MVKYDNQLFNCRTKAGQSTASTFLLDNQQQYRDSKWNKSHLRRETGRTVLLVNVRLLDCIRRRGRTFFYRPPMEHEGILWKQLLINS